MPDVIPGLLPLRIGHSSFMTVSALPPEAEVVIVGAGCIGVAGDEDGPARPAGPQACDHLVREAVQDREVPRPVQG